MCIVAYQANQRKGAKGAEPRGRLCAWVTPILTFPLRGGRDKRSRRGMGEGYPPCETNPKSVSFRFICLISSDFVAGRSALLVTDATDFGLDESGFDGWWTPVSRGGQSVVKLRVGCDERNGSTDVLAGQGGLRWRERGCRLRRRLDERCFRGDVADHRGDAVGCPTSTHVPNNS